MRENLDHRRVEGLYRSRRVTDGAQGPELIVDGRRMLAFCSNDYLGLAADPRLAEMVLVKNSRLSVQPVTPEEWRIVCEMAGVDP